MTKYPSITTNDRNYMVNYLIDVFDLNKGNKATIREMAREIRREFDAMSIKNSRIIAKSASMKTSAKSKYYKQLKKWNLMKKQI